MQLSSSMLFSIALEGYSSVAPLGPERVLPTIYRRHPSTPFGIQTPVKLSKKQITCLTVYALVLVLLIAFSLNHWVAAILDLICNTDIVLTGIALAS
tara:strand:+ start:89 stop:379 length:291 start_codon:yes stop_codon:yes gene_type:complete